MKSNIHLSNTEVRIGIGIGLGLLLCQFIPRLQALSICTAVIMCSQDSSRISWKAGITRLLGVLVGGLLACIVVFIDNAVQNNYLFYAMSGVAMILDFLILRALKKPEIVARVSCITIILVLVILKSDLRYVYALNRLIATAVGAFIAVIVGIVFEVLTKKRSKKNEDN